MNEFREFIEAVPKKIIWYNPEKKCSESQYEDILTTREEVAALMNSLDDRIFELENYLNTVPRENWQIIIKRVTEGLIYSYGNTRLAVPTKPDKNNPNDIGEVRRCLMIGLFNAVTAVQCLAHALEVQYPAEFIEQLDKQGFGNLGLTSLMKESGFIGNNLKTNKKEITLRLPERLDTDEAKELRDSLIEKGYISNQTKEDVFLYQFGCLGDTDTIQPIIWTKKNSRAKIANKKSLLDLLVLIGYDEKQIRQNVNSVFSIDKGKKFTPQDYSNYKNWEKDIISEYHTELEEIVNKIRNKTT